MKCLYEQSVGNMDFTLEPVAIKNRVYKLVKDSEKSSINTKGAEQICRWKYIGCTLAGKKRTI